jgi:hypothetical protein
MAIYWDVTAVETATYLGGRENPEHGKQYKQVLSTGNSTWRASTLVESAAAYQTSEDAVAKLSASRSLTDGGGCAMWAGHTHSSGRRRANRHQDTRGTDLPPAIKPSPDRTIIRI